MNYAALASLSRFKLPSFSLDNKLNTFTTISKNSGKKIFLNHLPILMSFSILNSDKLTDNSEEKTNDFFVFDPTVNA
jgi:exosome complex RNA-binding protein Rrp42 (RNase PH superfamily)